LSAAWPIDSAYADDTATNARNEIKTAYEYIEESAKMQLLTEALFQCAAEYSNDGKALAPNDAQQGKNLFGSYVNRDDPWLEEIVQGSVDDARIDCNEGNNSLIAQTASALGIEMQHLVCDADDPTKPGILKQRVYDVSKGSYVDGKCNDWGATGNTVLYYYNCPAGGCAGNATAGQNEPWAKNILKAYQRWHNKDELSKVYSADIKSQSELFHFTAAEKGGYLAYTLYRKDLTIGCKSNLRDVGETGDRVYTNQFKYIEPETGIIESRWIAGDIKPPGGNSSGGRTFIGNFTCTEIAKRASDFANNMQTKMFDYIKKICGKYLKKQLIDDGLIDEYQAVIDEGSSEEAVANAKKYLATAEAAVRDDKYWKEIPKEDGPPARTIGRECLNQEDLPGISGVNWREYDEIPEEEASTCNTGTALGWILCPVAEFLGGLIDSLYVWMEENLLNIPLGIFSSDSDTFRVWQVFRDIANVVFVILLLVVILSQATGIGINNYGIKKVLPKIIMMALLVNLSFYVCQLAVDLSNIVGNQVYRILTSMPNTSMELESFTEGSSGGGIVAVILGGGLTIGLFAFGALGGLMLILLGALIAILLAFLILIVRQAAVVLLIVLSPLAFVCYMLPNTEKLFQKWLGMFKGMLLIFPMIGVVMGSGKLAGAIIQHAKPDDKFFTLVGIACTILPFFALPSLIRGSMNALGTLGAKIAGMRAGAGMRARGMASVKKAPANSALGRKIRGGVGDRIGNSRLGKSSVGRMIGVNRWGARQTAAVSELDAADTKAAVALAAAQEKRKGAFATDDELADAMNRAYRAGDTATGDAMHSKLVSHGSSGLNAIYNAVREMEKNAKDGDAKAQSGLQAWKTNVRDQHSGTYKAKAMDMFDAASGGDDLIGYDYTKSIKGMEDAELAGQGKGFWARAATGGEYNTVTASANNPTVTQAQIDAAVAAAPNALGDNSDKIERIASGDLASALGDTGKVDAAAKAGVIVNPQTAAQRTVKATEDTAKATKATAVNTYNISQDTIEIRHDTHDINDKLP
jgi:translation initiation factor 2 beta subunit (eIF-2beta)/eIF-5